MTGAIYTLGCKANQADSDQLAAELRASGLQMVNHKEKADIYIINTCTVTSKAAYQSRQAVRRFIKKNPAARIIVMGCDVEVEREVLEDIGGVALVVGREEKVNVLDFVVGSRTQEARGTKSEHHASCLLPPTSSCRARPFIKIQDGCGNFCSYCIVPYTRGKMQSIPAEKIISTVGAIADQGYYEIVLTGIHIGAYGKEKGGGIILWDLLNRILAETEIPRIRLSSLEPDEIDTPLIKLIAKSRGRICPHLHIPLQSGCDNTLQRMNRRYSIGEYRECINEIKSYLPGCAIGADVVTGFPGESEEEFESTFKFIESLPLTYLHVFSYSDRRGTEAFNHKDKVSEPVKRERTQRLRELSTKKRAQYLKLHIGHEVTVVFDNNRIDGYQKGISENYINVLVNATCDVANHHRVKLINVCEESMMGELVPPHSAHRHTNT